MNIKTISIAALAFALAACQKGESGAAMDAAPAAAGPAAQAAPAPEAFLTNADIRIIAPHPAPAGQMAMYDKLGSDAVSMVTPMPNNGPAVALIGSGLHDMALMQDGCKFAVVVTLKNSQDAAAAPVVLNLSMAGQKTAVLPGDDLAERRVEIQMDPAAADNYSCNVMLRNKG